MPVKSSKKVIPASEAERVIIYPTIEVFVCNGRDALTAEAAKDLLGWSETEKPTKDTDKDVSSIYEGAYVTMGNNSKNRYITNSTVYEYMQDILNGKWRFNGETIVISKTGMILSGQHRLLALILADKRWHGDQKQHYLEKWPDGPPIMETLLVKGIEETDDIFQTMNAGKPMGPAETLYRSEYLKKVAPAKRKAIAKMSEHAVKLTWHRTGANNDAFSPKQTNSEFMDFVSRHGKLFKAVEHIYTENTGNNKDAISGEYISPGYASSMMYLMAASMSDINKYHKVASNGSKAIPSEWHESSLDFNKVLYEYKNKHEETDKDGKKHTITTNVKVTIMDAAREFWTQLANASSDVSKYVKKAITMLRPPASDNYDPKDDPITRAEKMVVLINAWLAYLAAVVETAHIKEQGMRARKEMELRAVKMTPAKLKPKYKTVNDRSVMTDVPTIGGIDIGDPNDSEELEKAIRAMSEPPADEKAEIEKRKQAERARKDKAKKEVKDEEAESTEAGEEDEATEQEVDEPEGAVEEVEEEEQPVVLPLKKPNGKKKVK
jgi:hypothetical protein